MISDALKNLSNLSKKELEIFRFRPFSTTNGIEIMLIPKMVLRLIPEGTKLISVYGDHLTLGVDNIDTKTTVEGYILYGVVPKVDEDKLSIPIGDIIQYAYFEAVPWYLNRIGSVEEKERKSSQHFNDLHSRYQGISSRAEYLEKHAVEGLAYLLLFSAVSAIFHGNSKKVLQPVIEFLGYSPIKGDWSYGEKFIEDELRSRMTPEDIKKVSLGTHRNSIKATSL